MTTANTVLHPDYVESDDPSGSAEVARFTMATVITGVMVWVPCTLLAWLLDQGDPRIRWHQNRTLVEIIESQWDWVGSQWDWIVYMADKIC